MVVKSAAGAPSFTEWKEGFPVGLVKTSFNAIVKGNKADYSTTINYSEFQNAVIWACFCASRYNKEHDKYIEQYYRDKECLKSVTSQLNAIEKINDFIHNKASILNRLDSNLSEKITEYGIVCDTEATGIKFRILNDVLACYRISLNDLKLRKSFRVGCLRYYSRNHPKNIPLVEGMLTLHLAVYFDGLKKNQPLWNSYRDGIEIDIPRKFEKTVRHTKQMMADLIEHSLGKPISTDAIGETLNKRVKHRMKLIQWPE